MTNHRCSAISLGSFGTFSSFPTPRCGRPICPGKQPPFFVCILIHSNLSMIAALKLAENFAKRRESFANKKLRQTFLIKLFIFGKRATCQRIHAFISCKCSTNIYGAFLQLVQKNLKSHSFCLWSWSIIDSTLIFPNFARIANAVQVAI